MSDSDSAQAIVTEVEGTDSLRPSGVVEKLARIISPIDWEAFDNEGRERMIWMGLDTKQSIAKARAVLSALRDIEDEAFDIIRQPDAARWARGVWYAMIDEALK